MLGRLKFTPLIVYPLALIGGGTIVEAIRSTKSAHVRVAFPEIVNVKTRTSLGCKALIGTDITGSSDKDLTDGIEGKVEKGVDDIAISVKDASTITFLSEAAFKSGLAEGNDFKIVENNDVALFAYYFNGSSINTFVLNKTNGLAIWSKVRPTFLGYDAPDAGETYLRCS